MSGPVGSAAPDHVIVRGRFAGTAVVRVVGLACTLLVALFLARLLGAAEFGRNVLALSWAAGLGTVGLAGTDQLLLRELSADPAPARVAAVRAFARRRSTVTTAIGVALAAVVAMAAIGESLLPAMCAIVVLLGAVRRRQALLLAEGRTVVAQAGESVGVPLLQLAFAVPLLWVGVARRSAVVTVSAYAFAIAVVVVAQSRAIGPWPAASEPRADAVNADQERNWAAASRSFALVSTVVLAQASIDLWILYALGTHSQAGRYAVAVRLAALVAFPLTVTTYALAREAAALHGAGRTAELQGPVTNAARLGAGMAALIGAAVVLLAPAVGSVLGRSFDGVTAPLLVLVAGQLANVVTGPVATLLLMTGNERDVRNTLLLATVMNAGVTASLVPTLGAVGAAIGAATSLLAWNLVLSRIVRRRLGVAPGPLALSRLS